MADEMIAGRYRTEGVLGSGSMGVVWRAHDTVLDRTVALKEMTVPEGINADEAVERFLTEARAAARLSHTNIVTVHDVLADGDRVLMAMELLQGPTLAQAIAAAGGGLPASDVRAVMAQVASALAEAHAAGVVHRDLKPDNVFWLPSGRVVVCDFGLAKIGAGRGTRVGTVMGTPGYLAPEQVRGDHAGPAADVFAWGAVAYEMLCGRPAFGDASEDQVTLIWRVVNEDPPPLVLPDDPDLARLVGWSLAKDPDERPPNGHEVFAALGGQAAIPTAITSRPSNPPRTSSAPPWAPVGSVPPKPPRSGPKPGLVIGGVLAVVLVVLAVVVAVVAGGGGGGDRVVVGANDTVIGSGTTEATADKNGTTIILPASRLLSPSLIVATSTAPPGIDSGGATITYDPERATDGLPDTAWRSPGDATGQRLTIQLANTSRVTKVGLIPGYAKVDRGDGTDRFSQNRRVTRVAWIFDDGSVVEQVLADSPTIQHIAVDVSSASVRLEIRQVTGHGGRDFTAISEIEVYGS